MRRRDGPGAAETQDTVDTEADQGVDPGLRPRRSRAREPDMRRIGICHQGGKRRFFGFQSGNDADTRHRLYIPYFGVRSLARDRFT